MFQNVLQTIEGIGIYPLISLIIFFSMFLITILWFFKADKGHLDRMAKMPLDSNSKNQGKED